MVKATFRFFLVLIGLAAILLAAGFSFEEWARARDARLYEPPGKLIDVGGHRLHILCMGGGDGPTIVIEAGSGVGLVSYLGVQKGIAEFARICSYDRAGIAWSEPTPTPRTFERMAGELAALLQSAEVPAPYVLAGHSFGGGIVRVFARDYSDRTAGLVLVETGDEAVAFHPEAVAAFAQARKRNEVANIMHRFGLVRLVPPLLGPYRNARPEIKAAILRPGIFKAMAREGDAINSIPKEQRKAGGFGILDGLPVAVIVRGRPNPGSTSEFEAAWQEANRRLATLSTDSVLIVARDSGHDVQREQPDLFIATVRRVHSAARDGVRLAETAPEQPTP